MTNQGGDFGEQQAHDEANPPPHHPEARAFGAEFVQPAYAEQTPAQPQPSAPHSPPGEPVPPWSPPPTGYPPSTYPPPSGYGPPGYPGAAAYGRPSYPSPPPQYGQSYPGGYGQQPGYGAPMGYGGPPAYPGSYDPYGAYQDRSHETNGLAIGSLITSIVGLLFGAPLTLFCYIGVLIPIVGTVLGAVALNQIKQTNQQGRGLAIAGIAVGAVAVVLVVIVVIVVIAAMANSRSTPSFT